MNDFIHSVCKIVSGKEFPNDINVFNKIMHHFWLYNKLSSGFSFDCQNYVKISSKND